MWSGCSRSREKVTASRSLCYSTTQLLYQGAGILEEQSQEALLAKCSIKSHLLIARLRVRSSLRETSPFSIHIKVELFSCVYACLLYILLLFLWQINMIGNCSGPFTSEIKASCQYLKTTKTTTTQATTTAITGLIQRKTKQEKEQKTIYYFFSMTDFLSCFVLKK